ncbi:MOSC N-terminal beta barrel domain-containing protein [Streptomyces sp. NPDC086554]|uniref:MOSC domain-containing protein n=1 Tax=Streptomyces sp. NPDC086554 TaxID=3154864 RepID=UPI00341BABF1
MAAVVDLITYPVKGCSGTSVAEAQLTRAGLQHDRSFMVVDSRGVFRSQWRDPRFAVIRPEPSPDAGLLTLQAAGAEALCVEVDITSTRRDVTLFGTPYRGIDQGEAAARWLTDVLDAESRLVRVPPEHDRVADGLTSGTSGYADSSPVHIISRATLNALNERIAAAGGTAVPMSRFRPNVVLDGWDEPHLEDQARRIVIGGAELGFAKLAIRCAVTLVDQTTGSRTGPEPLRTLASYRRASDGGVAFGAKYSVLQTGELAVGDELAVTAWEVPAKV